MKIQRTTLTALTLVLLPAAKSVDAATLVQYHDGTASFAAYNEAAGITGSAISYESDESFRTSFGNAGVTPAGPTAATAAGSNWRLWRKNLIGAAEGALSATQNYAGFTITVGVQCDRQPKRIYRTGPGRRSQYVQRCGNGCRQPQLTRSTIHRRQRGYPYRGAERRCCRRRKHWPVHAGYQTRSGARARLAGAAGHRWAAGRRPPSA